ncbi:MAG: hypothetical protein QME65_03905 [Candidatus Omnitrophota bacterium]|nr:hypothetical protein [Candidatus Omnitrophota bacterium]
MSEEERLREIFNNEYKKSKIARFDYEVFNGKRSFRGLVELEAALHHVALSFRLDTQDKIFEIESTKNHLQRIAIDLTEEVAESLCLIVRGKLNPFLRHSFLCKIMLVPRPDMIDSYWEETREYERLIIEGRSLKGEKEKFNRCYECFKAALEGLWNLNTKIPPSSFLSHLFTLLVGVLSIIVGFLLGLLVR